MYFANMLVNGSTTLQKDLLSTNKSQLAKQIARSAKANCYVDNEFSWKVWNEKSRIVAAGAGRKTEKGFAHYNCKDLIGELI